jgi:hypothetical protein
MFAGSDEGGRAIYVRKLRWFAATDCQLSRQGQEARSRLRPINTYIDDARIRGDPSGATCKTPCQSPMVASLIHEPRAQRISRRAGAASGDLATAIGKFHARSAAARVAANPRSPLPQRPRRSSAVSRTYCYLCRDRSRVTPMTPRVPLQIEAKRDSCRTVVMFASALFSSLSCPRIA